jgi:membrane-associated phospholipid phosphatase
MNILINRVKQHRFFFYGYLIVLIAGSLLLLCNGKTNSFLLLNEYHLTWIDYFFIGYTYFGDGLFALLLVGIFFFIVKKRKLAVILLIAYSSTGILAQVIKPLVHSPRPETYFFPQRLPFFIDNIIHAGDNSFPSGHTVTAFAVAAVLALHTSNRSYHFLLLFAAVMVGYSRIYLSQHFFLDVLAGSFIGALGGLLCVHFTRNIDENKLLFGKERKIYKERLNNNGE